MKKVRIITPDEMRNLIKEKGKVKLISSSSGLHTRTVVGVTPDGKYIYEEARK